MPAETHTAAGRSQRIQSSQESAGSHPPKSPPLADVVDRLFADFETQLALPVVLGVVWRCHRELDIVAGPALPELVERLARQRLHDLAAARTSGTEAGHDTAPATDRDERR